jgi:hypothetical protein
MAASADELRARILTWLARHGARVGMERRWRVAERAHGVDSPEARGCLLEILTTGGLFVAWAVLPDPFMSPLEKRFSAEGLAATEADADEVRRLLDERLAAMLPASFDAAFIAEGARVLGEVMDEVIAHRRKEDRMALQPAWPRRHRTRLAQRLHPLSSSPPRGPRSGESRIHTLGSCGRWSMARSSG